MIQLDMFAPPPPPPAVVIEPESDPVMDALVAAGLVSNSFMIGINHCLTNHNWQGLPSRMFQFPVAFVDRSRSKDGESHLVLYHNDLATFPFVIEIFEKTGIKCEAPPSNRFGQNSRYHHAVDLCTRKHWRDMLVTRNYTDAGSILNAVEFALNYNEIDTRIAREILTAINISEPDDHSAAHMAAGGVRVRMDGKVSRPEFKWSLGFVERVWLCLHAIEQGLIKHKGGFMYLTPAGIDMFHPITAQVG